MSIHDEISELEKKLAAKKHELATLPFDPLGAWKITTEGDVEGRSTKVVASNIVGNVFDLAKQFGRQAFYSLSFERMGYVTNKKTGPAVHVVNFNVTDNNISFGDKGTMLRHLTPSLPIGHKLEESNYYGSIKLIWEE